MRTTVASRNRARGYVATAFLDAALVMIAACSDGATPTTLTSSPPPLVPPTPVLASIQVTPGSATLYHAETLPLTVLLRDPTGQPITYADSMSFVSSSDQVATVDAHGLITAVGLGQASISVSVTLHDSTKRAAVVMTVARPAGRLAFSYSSAPSIPSQIYTLAPDGTDLRQVTADGRGAGHPSWSPDGARIAFERSDSGSVSSIYAVNADGSNLVRIAGPGNSPTWLADGRIAFVCTAGVCVTSANGAAAQTLIPSDALPDAADFDFTWSPDGSMVAFTRESDLDGDPFNQVYVMNADGSRLQRLASLPGGQWSQSSPRWSPDGKRIVFWSTGYGVSIINPDGSNFHSISGFAGITARPDWSPDGTHIVFGTMNNFFVANANGSGMVQFVNAALTPAAGSSYGDWWSWSSR
jgi:TolB protein